MNCPKCQQDNCPGWEHVRYCHLVPPQAPVRIEYDPGPRGDPRFHAILAELGALHDRKQADYGLPGDPLANLRASTGWSVPAWVGALIRLNDKVQRLQAFARRGTLVNEGAVDSLNDIAVYAILARILLEEVPMVPTA